MENNKLNPIAVSDSIQNYFVPPIYPETKTKNITLDDYVIADQIIRIVKSAKGSKILFSINTADMASLVDVFVENILKTNEVLIKVIKYLKRSISYNGYYNSYLLGMISKNEFKDISNDFTIYHDNRLNIDDINCLTHALKDNTDINFDIEEISDIFEIKESELIKYLEKRKRIIHK